MRGVYKCVASTRRARQPGHPLGIVAALPPVIHQEKAENISASRLSSLSIHIHCTRPRPARPCLQRWVLRGRHPDPPSQFVHGNLFVFPHWTLHPQPGAQDSGRRQCVAANLVASGAPDRAALAACAANARITGTSPQRTDLTAAPSAWIAAPSGDPWPRTA